MKNKFLIVIMLFSFQSIWSQQLGSIQGKVTLDNDIILGVNVYLVSNTSIGVSTDIDGNYK